MLLPPDLAVGRHRPEPLYRRLLPLHLHGVQLPKHGLLLREQRRLHIPVGWVFSISLNSLFTYYLPYRVRLLLQQQLPQESLLMHLLLRVAVKHRRTIQLSAVAVLLLPVVQCFTVTTRRLPRMRIVSDNLFSRLIFNVNVDFLRCSGTKLDFRTRCIELPRTSQDHHPRHAVDTISQRRL